MNFPQNWNSTNIKMLAMLKTMSLKHVIPLCQLKPGVRIHSLSFHRLWRPLPFSVIKSTDAQVSWHAIGSPTDPKMGDHASQTQAGAGSGVCPGFPGKTQTFHSIRGKLPKCLRCATVVMPGEVQWSWTSPGISKPKEQAVAPYIFSY